MSKSASIAQVSAKGTFHYMWGLIASTVISSVGSIFIGRLLGPNFYGLYTIVFAVINILLIFRDWGVNSAMIRCAAQYRAEGRESEIRSVFAAGLIWEIALGLILSIMAFLLSGFLANAYNRPVIAPLIQIVSFSILASGLVAAASAAFTGLERMELNSIMLICQSLVKTVLVIGLVVAGFGLVGATTGFLVGNVVAGILGVFLIWTLYRKLPKSYSSKLYLKAYMKAMLTYGVPISLATIISSFLAQFFTFLLPLYYANDNTIIGNYGIALNFVVLITFFATPITAMLFPAFSKLDPQKDKESLKNVFQFSVRYAALFVVPVAALVMALAKPAIATLFGETYSSAPLFLALLAITYIYPAFGNLSTTNLLNGQGQTTYNLKLTMLTAAIGFPVGTVLILNFGVLGLIAATLTVGIPSLIVQLRWIKNRYGLTVDWLSSVRIILSSAITAVLTYSIVSLLTFAYWMNLIIGVLLFVLIFVPTALVTRTITHSDLANLRLMLGGIGVLGRIINQLLGCLEKIMTILRL
jgi:O-antigen/teichoic acid export membrane protein